MSGRVVVGRALVQVSQHGDQFRAVRAQGVVDGADPGALPPPQRVGVAAGERLALEVVRQQEQLAPARQPQLVDRAVPAEQGTAGAFGVGVVHVAADRLDRDPRGGHHADVDAARVVAVHQHGVRVPPAQQGLVEPDQRRPVLGLDQAQDVRGHLVHDLRRHAGGDLVDRFGDQVHPADPVAATGGHDRGVPAAGLLEEVAAVLPQQRPRAERLRVEHQAVVGAHQDLEGFQVLQHLPLVDLGVGGFGGDGAEPAVGGEHGAGVTGERLGPLEQVLDVEGRDSDGHGDASIPGDLSVQSPRPPAGLRRSPERG
nr:hypothetical protein GCM10017745_41420 [Saccharothrix mutabilis subsp. capreolus]